MDSHALEGLVPTTAFCLLLTRALNGHQLVGIVAGCQPGLRDHMNALDVCLHDL